jgi:hypothetical protein
MDHLDKAAIVLTPHWRTSVASLDRINYDLLQNEGLYNAGFVASSRAGRGALQLWAENCFTICIKDACKGQYVDQTHLNLLPIYFDGIHILKHRGCNVANWNIGECRRSPQSDGTVLIQDTYPIVFIHFTKSMITGVLKGQDPHLLPHLEKFNATLLKFDPALDLITITRARLERERAEHKVLEQQYRKSPIGLMRRLKRRLVHFFN